MKAKAKALFLKRFESLVQHVLETQKDDPVVRIAQHWDWVEPLCEEKDGVYRYKNVEILRVA